MTINRRTAILTGLSASATAILAPGTLLAAGQDCDSTESETDQNNILRHYVLATGSAEDQDAALAGIKEKLGLSHTYKKDLTELGFSTAMVIIGKTVLEIVAPFSRGRRPHVDHFLDERGGPGLYKLVVQTFDAEALRKRIYEFKLKLDRDDEFRGHQMITFNTGIFATSLEAFTYTPLDKWWGYDSSIDYAESAIVEEVMGCDLAVDNPGAVSTLIASIFNAELDPETATVTFQKNTTVPFDSRYIRCVSPSGGRDGVLTLDLKVKDRNRVGEVVSVSGVDFKFV